ncbi:hypothetical protein [Actinomycetospora sp. TBRC 11914]|uniref:hypothetical protein n=1 Tax=Actinomycetospora sp. TBRC 11914 TaxID=2729387 RepID=UPI00145DD30A|nr:hypothetical protein [Actinomycetospora sp. TBRC 11914]NMO90878.1 hypothetical protein [Actinomycetospora sp. TBRC 11914]
MTITELLTLSEIAGGLRHDDPELARALTGRAPGRRAARWVDRLRRRRLTTVVIRRSRPG